ncbi:helix-turn-helix domain-containing protein [Streptomyces flaveus]|uniref:Transcriptional regulator n=1 Tax=Streptomyces flaveus TaxID=66370 RepID=A0A917RI07_9ACTN|nr:helix-turn-helix transcriptional regulator [Streptomyces flaveus]GGL07929.1 transcriptional regulator [Streptomyces flaveus]
MTGSAAHHELGEFLKTRRAELTPRSVGLPDSGAPRRVPGLRREEVALLAAISTDYYTRLEQGRIDVSEPVLASLARVLKLDDDQREYAFQLAGKETGRLRRPEVQVVNAQLQRLLDDLGSIPAMVLGRQMDVLAWNEMGAALVGDFGQIPEKDRNYAKMIFSDRMRGLYADWEGAALLAVAQLRMEVARDPDSPTLVALVEELSERDADFRRWWAEHHVAARRVGAKTLNHPVVGELTVEWDTLTCSTDPDQHLTIWTAPPGTPTQERLRLLAAWVADGHSVAPGAVS